MKIFDPDDLRAMLESASMAPRNDARSCWTCEPFLNDTDNSPRPHFCCRECYDQFVIYCGGAFSRVWH